MKGCGQRTTKGREVERAPRVPREIFVDLFFGKAPELKFQVDVVGNTFDEIFY